MALRIVRAITYDVRFPTSLSGAGSDAMNPDPDYSAAYVALETDDPRGLTGHGLTFTIGWGTEVCVAAIEALAPHVVGETVEDLVADLGRLWRRLVTDTQLRWLGPEKGVIHLATAAIVNASGTSTRSSRESRSGRSSPTCRLSVSWRASTSATSTTR
jgi:L-fuconate dehydratase